MYCETLFRAFKFLKNKYILFTYLRYKFPESTGSLPKCLRNSVAWARPTWELSVWVAVTETLAHHFLS